MQKFDDFDSARCCVQVPSVHQSSVVFRPVTVNMNAPPSVCLPKHFPLSVLLSFTFSFCSLLPTSSLLCLYCPSSPLTLLFFFFIFLSHSSSTTLPHLFSFLPYQQTDRQAGAFCPIRSLGFDHMPVEDRPRPAALLMQGKPWAPTFGKSCANTRPFSPPSTDAAPPPPKPPAAAAPPPPPTIPPRLVLIMAASMSSCKTEMERKRPEMLTTRWLSESDV